MRPFTTTPNDRPRFLLRAAAGFAIAALLVLVGYLFLSPSLWIRPPAVAAAPAPEPASTPPVPTAPHVAPESVQPPAGATGQVVNEAEAALRGASVWSGTTEVRTDADGRFSIASLGPERTVLVKLPGYERKRVAVNGKPL